MPVHECTSEGKPGYAYGGATCYTYAPGDEAGRKEAKRKAFLQGSAIESNGGKADAEKDDPGTGDVHIATAIGTSMRQRRKYPTSGPKAKDITVIKGFVNAREPGADGVVPVWIRSARLLALKAYRVLKSADPKIQQAKPEGMAPIYDLVLRPMAVEVDTADEDVDETPDREVRFLKAAAQQKVLGVVLEPHRVDTQGDYENPDEIEAACHQFANDYRLMKTHVGLQHQQMLSDDRATVIENYILPVDATIGGQEVPKGSWLQMVHVKDPAIWKGVCDGEITGFSFGGSGLRRPVAEADMAPTIKRAGA